MPCCQYCGRRFLSDGLPGCPYCRKPPAPKESRTYLKAHLRKRRGVWGVRSEGYYSTRLTTSSTQIKGSIDCLCLAALWNTRNA